MLPYVIINSLQCHSISFITFLTTYHIHVRSNIVGLGFVIHFLLLFHQHLITLTILPLCQVDQIAKRRENVEEIEKTFSVFGRHADGITKTELVCLCSEIFPLGTVSIDICFGKNAFRLIII